MILVVAIQIALLIIQVVLFFFCAYLVLLMAAAWFAPRTTADRPGHALTRFAILIPAHNEEVCLPELLGSIRKLDYPTTHYDVRVIVDNCTDNTAAVVNSFGAQAHIRFNNEKIGKGYALEWGLAEIHAAGQLYDAIIIIDADSTISPNFLRVMHNQAAAGASIVQSYYAVKDPGLSWNVSLRYAALTVLHFLRPQGRMVLGGSAGLKGNGMMFTHEVITRFPWPASVTEDIEYHMLVLLGGYTVRFAPDAVVWGEMPVRFEQSQSQLDRWEYGRIEMARKYIPGLLQAAGKSLVKLEGRNVYRFLDSVIEHLIPPFSILYSGALLCFAAAAALFIVVGITGASQAVSLSWINLGLSLFLVLSQTAYLLSGLHLANAPKVVYRQLVYAPLFVIRKIGQYGKVLSGKGPRGWVRTTRNQS